MEPIIITTGLTDKTVAWVTSGVSNELGQQQVLGPDEIWSRWELGTRLISDALVESYNAAGIVYLGEPLAVGTLLWKGSLAELPVPPVSLTGLFKIVEYREIPDRKGRRVRLSAIVAETKEVLPDVITPSP